MAVHVLDQLCLSVPQRIVPQPALRDSQIDLSEGERYT